MNTNNIKKVAPQARRIFISAVMKRLNELGIYSDSQIAECVHQGELLDIEGRHFDVVIKPLRDRLVSKVKTLGFLPFVENIAYTWFNRLCAIRYMELQDYLDHGLRVLSHPTNPNTFEILEHAQDIAEDLGLNRERIIELKLSGNKDEILYRELLIGQCHQLHKAMPFLFEALDDETELLLPDNLTRTDSILRSLVNDIPEEDWQQVEVIGWLYQFYISEKKDQVIGKVVKSEDIPAATQLFTPNWIVKYLVQNSVGRQWLQTYPDSSIKSQMEYYIEPAEQSDEVKAQLADITPDSIEPESIKMLDPACGSGHILVEAYKVLKAIYEERGYRGRDIPQLILENNLFGLDIDDRAAQLAGFALMMLARADDRRIFTRDITLNVLSIQETSSVDFDLIWRDLEIEGSALYHLVHDVWTRFNQGKTFGSLVDIPSDYEQALINLLNKLNDIESNGELFQRSVATSLIPIIRQAWLLAQRYDAVVANPPYMGANGMNGELKKFAKANYPDSKSDLFSIYIERCLDLGVEDAELGLVTPYVWMFITSYEKIRERLVHKHTLNSLIQLEYNAFAPACIPVCTFTISKKHIVDFSGTYVRLSDFKGHQNQAPKTLEAIKNKSCTWRFETKPEHFLKIPGTPIAYWASKKVFDSFINRKVSDVLITREGMATADNLRFLRLWYEVSQLDVNYDCKEEADSLNKGRWFPYNKGGSYRKWYGNNEFLVEYESCGQSIKNNIDPDTGRLRSHNYNGEYAFKEGITWSALSSGSFSIRYSPKGYLFDSKGAKGFTDNPYELLALLNSIVSSKYLEILAPTLDYKVGDIIQIPFIKKMLESDICSSAKECVSISKWDWDCFESSWDFEKHGILSHKQNSMFESYMSFREYSLNKTERLHQLEQKLNEKICAIYGLDILTDLGVKIEEVSLRTNIYYRYGNIAPKEKLENRFKSDTNAEFISYAIGCMMGRYSLDRESLIYAHSGNEGFTDLVAERAYKTFLADDDGIIPLTDQDWFADDATNRFREFVRVVWGEEHLQENLDFVVESLCLYAIKPKRGESNLETIRRYLSNQFYKDHLKTYKKRPIYWLFSSGKQKAFECLVYLHRYNEGTLARMRTEYVTPLLGKYDAYSEQLQKQMDDATSTAEANRLKKEQAALQKKQNELREFDDKLKHYADRRISLNLDDGVKVNYGKFGDLLVGVKSVTGKKPEIN